MLTAAVQSPGFHKPVYYRHPTYLWTRQRRRRRSLSLSSRICHCAAVPRHTSRIAGHRRWTSVKHRSTAWEASSFRHHHLHLLWFVCRTASTVRSSLFTPSSVPVHPRFVPSRHKSNSETHRTAFCVARHTERLPHLGAGLPSLPALQSLPPHSTVQYSVIR
jgi:hypothetical protein